MITETDIDKLVDTLICTRTKVRFESRSIYNNHLESCSVCKELYYKLRSSASSIIVYRDKILNIKIFGKSV